METNQSSSDFTGKVAIVSGGGSGIGAATAKLLAAGGASVVLSDINLSAAEKIAAEITASGGKAAPFKADASKPEDSQATVEFAKKTYGALHLAYNNAGIVGPEKYVGDLTPEGWQSVINLNLNGVFYAMHYQIPAILASGGGAIVNTSSIAGFIGIANLSAYVASKHGVAGLTKSASIEYGKQGIRINSVHPGYIMTPLIAQWTDTDLGALEAMHPIGRLGQPEEIAEVVYFLLSNKASFMSGSQVVVDGGFLSV
ncbi:SDR family NAD(P)-dependent oxidoreductase [Flavihumibacter sp. ZG627]|uniref:SDR family NAD(P)-dependent oxidoreductase n=1 Tax=Flavihumibacter sp. ZG627 TaxID=1463156 RepID=UPI00057E7100|nr:SDR family NAD(P)-dependent oxidoreductase [Flavihumibacter sp. ZG627]KIC90517.1 short-chain dehydrogenase [Flavihumibacter sp. ZG627]